MLAALGQAQHDGPTSDVEWSISGASNGWTYGATMDVDGTAASISVGTAGLGSITMSSGSVEWSGMNIAGFDVTVSADPADIEAASFGLVGSLGGLAIDATVNNDATRTFSAEIGTAVAGASVGIDMSGDLSDTSERCITAYLLACLLWVWTWASAWTKLAQSAFLLAWAL